MRQQDGHRDAGCDCLVIAAARRKGDAGVWLPEFGMVVGLVQAKLPGVEAAPPVSVEALNGWPAVMLLAVGGVVMVGVA